ncbi:hypothetical protein EAG_07959 [Camponotus floridanus]|uniref:Globin domain-containing protein n=1 Tax=Camponotus floridanus TaxID=104421 RepID=E2AF92_CAMFO|nr:hypothetical protein EAG_07959 [Camponotus floridanus]
MGTKQSVYEKSGTLDYYKFSAEEYALVKKVWSGIEINPQFHGNACLRSFCEIYPQYVKFFTQESKLHLSFDTRITVKFSIIMETMGYLLLDFNKRPKQLDRLVGYIAMVHKDMQLDEQDMRNFATSLFQYLSRTYPTQMTAQCQEAMSKFMDSVIKELFVKMELFRDYDVAQSGEATRSKLPWGQCPLFAEAPIFGKTKLYWDEWKKQWNARLDEWAAQAAAQEQVSLESISNDTRSRNDLEDENEITGSLQRKVSELRKRHDSDASASRLALLNLSEHQPNRTQKRDADKQRHQRRVSIQLPDRLKATKASRARYRAKNDDASRPQVDMKILSKDSPALGEAVSEDRDKEMIEQQEHESSEIATVKPQNTARERRRERFNVDLK